MSFEAVRAVVAFVAAVVLVIFAARHALEGVNDIPDCISRREMLRRHTRVLLPPSAVVTVALLLMGFSLQSVM